MDEVDESGEENGGSSVFPDWLEARLVPDGRFARAYDALGDSGRGQLKRIIAAHYALNPPSHALASTRMEVQRSGLSVATDASPLAYAVILCDGGLDAPAFLLPALVPALCAGVSEVLVVRLGGAGGLSRATLAACELAGQERVAALGAAQVQDLLAYLQAGGLPGVVLHADTPAVRRLFSRPGLGPFLGSGGISRVALPMPSLAGLWRDGGDDLPPKSVAQLYGTLPFEEPEGEPGEDRDFEAFAASPRDILLIPDARAGDLFVAPVQGARVVVCHSQLGLWTWNAIGPDRFLLRTTFFASEH